MQKTFRVIARSMAVIFAILFVVMALLALPLANAGWRLFGPRLYKRALIKQDTYGQIPTMVGVQVTHSLTYFACLGKPETADCVREASGREDGGEVNELLDPGITPFFLLNLTQTDIEHIVTDLAPSPWIQEQTESLIDQVFAYLNYGGEPTLSVSLDAFRERLSGEAGIRAFMRMAQAQPPCTPEQNAVISREATVAPEEMPICQPSQALEEAYTEKTEQALQAVADDVVKEIDLIALVEEEGVSLYLPKERGPLRDDPRAQFQLAKWTLRSSPLIPLLALTCMTLAIARSGDSWARWWSIPLLITGSIGLLASLVALPANWALCTYLVSHTPAELAPSVVNVGLDVERFIARSLVLWTAIECSVLTALGLLLLGVSSMQERRR
jgi:hypothetical protein